MGELWHVPYCGQCRIYIIIRSNTLIETLQFYYTGTWDPLGLWYLLRFGLRGVPDMRTSVVYTLALRVVYDKRHFGANV